ncbi:MAG: hypothetical protein AAGJ93_01200 [Bacteroidota bacterium]
MNHLLYTVVLCLFVLLSSCTSHERISLAYEDIDIEYLYKESIASRYYFSIYREVRVSRGNQELKFDLLPDIEMLDEARFFYTEDLLLDDTAYERVLLIKDPFAFAIIDLEEMVLLYNSHGEDNILDRITLQQQEKCIGKVADGKLLLNNCLVEF